MKLRSYTFTAFVIVGFTCLLLPAQRAAAQNNPDDQPHIQPRTTPTPTPTPRASQPSQKPQDGKSQDGYERPPFPGDTPGTPAASPRTNTPNGYERPAFPGDAPGTRPTGSSATGESSSRDSLIDLDARPEKEEPATPEDESVLKPW